MAEGIKKSRKMIKKRRLKRGIIPLAIGIIILIWGTGSLAYVAGAGGAIAGLILGLVLTLGGYEEFQKYNAMLHQLEYEELTSEK